MRFQKTFTRVKPAAAPDVTLGTDALPAGGPDAAASQPILFQRVAGAGQSAPQRVAVGYKYTGAGAPTIDVEAWVWDAESANWYLASSTTGLAPNTLAFLRIPSLAEPPQTQANIGKPNAGGSQVFILAKDTGGTAPNGTYLFACGADLARF